MSWLLYSIIASVVLTVLLNAGLRLFSGSGGRSRSPTSTPRHVDPQPASSGRSGWSFHFSWKWSLALTVIGTILLNLLL